MSYTLKDKLVVGISSRALFDLHEADELFRREGLAGYRAYQRAHENEILKPGAAFRLVRGLLAINLLSEERLVEVVVMSRNDADSAMRVFNSIEAHGLDISRGAFSGGRDPWPYLKSFRCSLFLSAEPDDVFRALEQGFPAALVLDPPDLAAEEEATEVRVAFDADAVLFDDQSERIFQREGLDAFQQNEADRADEPMSPGPFRPFLEALARLQSRFPEGRVPIRTALVTARAAPAHKRVVNTLRTWGVRIDETFFLGGLDKTSILEVLRPHIFFDDQMRHLERAASVIPSAHVLSGSHQLALFPRGMLESKRPPAAAPAGARTSAGFTQSAQPTAVEPAPGEAVEPGAEKTTRQPAGRPRLITLGEDDDIPGPTGGNGVDTIGGADIAETTRAGGTSARRS